MSFVIPDYSSIYCMGSYCVRYSYAIIAIIPILLFLYWFNRKTFVKFNNRLELEEYLKSKKVERVIVLTLRSIALVFLMLALSSPFILESRTVPGNPKLTILVDNSTSMSMYDLTAVDKLYGRLEGVIPVNVRTIASGEHSTIGNGILNNIEGDDHVMVVTDGVNNEGKLLGDIMLFASGINSSVSTLMLDAIYNDVGVTISGPAELIKDTEGDFIVKVTVVGQNIPYIIQIYADDNDLLLEQRGSESKQFKLSRQFPDGEYHTLTAKLLEVGEDDYFKQNNEFYKSVKIVPRPKILFVSEKLSPMAKELEKIYEVEIKNSLPGDLFDYMAVIVNDIHASKVNPHAERLSDYAINGNGLIFIGGENSFDRGSYKNTLLETLLPVKIGASEGENKSNINVVVVIDRSHGTEDYIAYEKALAIGVVDSLSDSNNVGVLFFGGANCKAHAPPNLDELMPLKDVKENIKDYISRVKFDGQSCFNIGIDAAYNNMLKSVGGSKNIIFISDGKTTNDNLRQSTLDAVRRVNAFGVKVFVVGVGTDTDVLSTENNLFLQNIANLGGGIYYKTDASNRINVEFGDKDDEKGEEFYNTLVPIDTTHFITLGLDDISATISGYNYGVPKPAARALVTTHKNIPILVVWRFGLGRVVTLTTDDGRKWGGNLLNKENSKLVTKSINWAIGDLSRKKSYDVTIRDAVLGKKTAVNVISREPPRNKDLSFAKIDTNLYSAVISPDKAGFHDLFGARYAVNYNDEFADLGISKEFTQLVDSTGGKIFDPKEIDEIIEFVKAKSKRIKIDSTNYRWPFAIIAMVIFLAEVALRRYRENLQR
jgi:uncharacterized membrane protein